MNNCKNFFKTARNSEGKISWNNKIITPLVDNKNNINGREFILTPEFQNALTDTKSKFENMNDDDILNFANILKTVDYNPRQDFYSNRRKYNESIL